MESPEPWMLRAARWTAFGSAASVVFSLAVSHTLLALAFASLLMSGAKLRLPRIWLPLGLFLLGTLISLAFSGSPADGLPQVRKIYVFLELLVVFSTFEVAWVRRLFWAWAVFGAASALLGCAQFLRKMGQARELGRPFYDYLMQERITGFLGHWNTFSAQMMFVVLFVLSFVLFARDVRGKTRWGALALGVVAAIGMVLSLTRAVIFFGCPAAVLYLLWWWRRWMVVAVPVLALAGVAVSPPWLKERFTSLLHPKKDVDSNEFRKVTFRTGLEMIKAHPWLGLGPERPKALFDQYVPKDIPRPLPTGWYGHLHSIYIHYAAERGIPTMLALVWMLVAILFDFLRGVRKLPPGPSDEKFILLAAGASVIGVMLEGFWELNLGTSPVLGMFLAIVACGYVALEKVRA